MQDALIETGLSKEDASEGTDLFVANAQFLGLIKTIAGSERLLTLDHALDELSAAPSKDPTHLSSTTSGLDGNNNQASNTNKDWKKICFYISPIGEEGSEHRKHADLILGSFVEPAMENIGLKVVRADMIGEPGLITTQILEHIKKSQLVIADLSYLNPNVFYEVALRHSLRLPVVQLIRKCDRLPFDVAQVRTVVLDTTNIFSLVPKMQVYISEISTQARSALENAELVGNPLSAFFPQFYD